MNGEFAVYGELWRARMIFLQGGAKICTYATDKKYNESQT